MEINLIQNKVEETLDRVAKEAYLLGLKHGNKYKMVSFSKVLPNEKDEILVYSEENERYYVVKFRKSGLSEDFVYSVIEEEHSEYLQEDIETELTFTHWMPKPEIEE